jgi:outer membrane protein OmpA-like peptidoglycan-associated protein
MTEGETMREAVRQRASLRRRPLRGVALAALLLGLCAGARVSFADETATELSDSSSAETLFDVIKTLPDRLVPKAAPDEPRSPDALFTAAMAELQAARFDEARRLLELFVVRDPQNPLVPEARRHLSELYQLDAKSTPHGAPAETATTAEVTPVAAPVMALQVATPQSVGGKLEDSFMLEAGDRVFFAPRSAELGTRARSVLAAQARWLKRNSSLSAVVEGHSDDPVLDNQGLDRLATERAEAVFRRLLEEGVAPERLAISPQGTSRPAANCRSADCAAQNRRAVTVLTAQRVSELPAAEALIGPQQP